MTTKYVIQIKAAEQLISVVQFKLLGNTRWSQWEGLNNVYNSI